MNFSSFFSRIQEADWYRQFLNPVINKLENSSTILDIGTGSGKLLQILADEKNISGVGIDTNQSMLDEAKNKLINNPNIKLQLIDPDEKLNFDNASFNNVSICNVLFHLNKESVFGLLSESIRVLKENGSIIILTPTGKNGFFKLIKTYLSFNNLGILIWYFATKEKALEWSDNIYVQKYCNLNNLSYKKEIILNGYAQVEIIYK